MLNDIYGDFEQRGFINYDTLLEEADELRLSNPRGAALTLLACQTSIARALSILQERAKDHRPLRSMTDGLWGHVTSLWKGLRPQNSALVLSLDDFRRWRSIEDSTCVEEEKLRELADIFIDYSNIVIAMQTLAERLIPERKGEDFAHVMTPVLFVAYLTDADTVPPKFITRPVFSGRGHVAEDLLEQMLDELDRHVN